MLIVMTPDATADQVEAVCSHLRSLGFIPQEIRGQTVAIGVSGVGLTMTSDQFSDLAGVSHCEANGEMPRMVRRDARTSDTVVSIRGASNGGGAFAIIAGPCAVESYDQVMQAAEIVADSGVKLFRGGAYKPRTSPYSFQGLREEGLKLLSQVKERFDLRIVTEIMDAETLPAVASVADVLQIGSRNMHNYPLLDAAGRAGQPLLLKRGMSATIQEWLLAAEYVMAAGNPQVILCERGIRTFETMTRNTLDLAGAIMAKRHTHLPVVVDPSHGVGIAWAVPALARAAAVSGVDGVMIEVHPSPESALSDGQQALNPAEFRRLAKQVQQLAGLGFCAQTPAI